MTSAGSTLTSSTLVLLLLPVQMGRNVIQDGFRDL